MEEKCSNTRCHISTISLRKNEPHGKRFVPPDNGKLTLKLQENKHAPGSLVVAAYHHRTLIGHVKNKVGSRGNLGPVKAILKKSNYVRTRVRPTSNPRNTYHRKIVIEYISNM
mmetsp:Transcript_2601/g.3759  ORF Transcript_2601/g.3759 Transcript_2601/m.3759 type:complete len:113 (+) Transcript_2601:173-511(+)